MRPVKKSFGYKIILLKSSNTNPSPKLSIIIPSAKGAIVVTISIFLNNIYT